MEMYFVMSEAGKVNADWVHVFFIMYVHHVESEESNLYFNKGIKCLRQTNIY